MSQLVHSSKRNATICTFAIWVQPSIVHASTGTKTKPKEKKVDFLGWPRNYSPLARPRRQRGICISLFLSSPPPTFQCGTGLRPALHLIPTVTGHHHHPRRSHTPAEHLYLALLLHPTHHSPPSRSSSLPSAVTFPNVSSSLQVSLCLSRAAFLVPYPHFC
jgi:hypothetical protein